MTLHAVAFSSANSATTIASALATSINANISSAVTAVASGNQVTVTAGGNFYRPRPATWSTFAVSQDNAVKTGSQIVDCCRGQLIKAGQYFFVDYGYTASGLTYVWFIVDGVGSDPNPDGYNWLNVLSLQSDAFSVSINSTDTEAQVATKLNTAATAAQNSGLVTNMFGTVSQPNSGSVVLLQLPNNVPAVTIPVGTVAQGFGTTGAVATNQWDSLQLDGHLRKTRMRWASLAAALQP